MSASFTLTSDQRDQLVAHARAEAPREACGMIGGRPGRARSIYTITNQDESERTYFMEPRGQFAAMRSMRENGEELVGIYHSHPATEAYPSPTDLKLAYYPDAVYIIVSLAENEPVLRGFNIRDGRIEEVDLAVSG